MAMLLVHGWDGHRDCNACAAHGDVGPIIENTIWLGFQSQPSATGRFQPKPATREFEEFLTGNRHENGNPRACCGCCGETSLVAICDTSNRRCRRAAAIRIKCQGTPA